MDVTSVKLVVSDSISMERSAGLECMGIKNPDLVFARLHLIHPSCLRICSILDAPAEFCEP